MVELLVAMALLTLIVLALMAVFNSTQRAFRASVTQTSILEGGRATVDMITTDLRAMVPSDGVSNYVYYGNNNYNYGPVNFFATNNSYQYEPLSQSLPGSSVERTNLLEYFFVLGRVNTKWTGVGYVVNSASSSPLFPLYRFYAETNIGASPVGLYWGFLNTIYNAQWTNMSHLLDGVVHLTVDAYDANGYQMTNTYQFHGSLTNVNRNIWFSRPEWSQVGFTFYTNAVPAEVELQLGILEDRTLQRAESLGVPGNYPSQFPNGPQWQYLQNQAGHVELFRQRVTIPNVDPSAYQ